MAMPMSSTSRRRRAADRGRQESLSYVPLKGGTLMTFYRRKKSNFIAVRRVTYCSDGFGEYNFSLLFYREYFPNGEKPYCGSCRPASMHAWGDEITEGEARRLIPNLDAQDGKCESP